MEKKFLTSKNISAMVIVYISDNFRSCNFINESLNTSLAPRSWST